MKYYLIAGERSGDLHASNLIRALKAQDPHADFRAWGGELSEAAGASLVQHYQTLAFMGFAEVLANLGAIRRALRLVKADILDYRPDVLILIDFAGFNLRMARFAKANGLRVFYYISPKVWAWNRKRAVRIKELVDRMFVIFPFEVDFYRTYDYAVDYVGNPIADAIANFRPNPNFRTDNELDERPILAILPGSRRQEVEEMLHYMVSILPPFMDFQFVVAAVPNLDRQYYEYFRRTNVQIVYDQTYDLLANAHAAVVTSGTATLETALFDVPQVVCYKGNFATYWIARALVQVKYISLVNLIADRPVVRELIQDEFTPANLMRTLEPVVRDEAHRGAMRQAYADIRERLGGEGASVRTARLMYAYLQEKSAQ